MVGGIVVQIVDAGSSLLVEVLDTDTMDRCWRFVRGKPSIAIHDQLWWQSHRGYLSRAGEFCDMDIGYCGPSSGPVIAQPQPGERHEKPRIIENPTEPIRTGDPSAIVWVAFAAIGLLYAIIRKLIG